MKKILKNKIIKNTKGQMAIFIAIIFQVLFVLFAMSINVALVVHDKINLQNSVDLAAYYGAQKQAELLNVIAHQNYQVRQAWKLLAWRYRVLGQYGVGSDFKDMPAYHPGRIRAQNRNSETEIFKPNVAMADEVLKETPQVCIGFKPTWVVPENASDQFCQERRFSIPRVDVSDSPIAAVSYQLQQSLNDSNKYKMATLARACDQLVAFNYAYATSILAIFRYEQKYRREIIYGLLNQMQASTGGFTDLNGDSVADGVKQMVEKNLTYSNLEGEPEVVYYNSLGNQNVNFFSSIDVQPRVYYTNSKDNGCDLTSGESRNVSQYPNDTAKQVFLESFSSGQRLYELSQDSPIKNSIFQYSLGLEKNPWNWVYSAVVAQTTTRPIFFPIGDPLVIKARAFAKPFGGRIGPWHKETWTVGDKRSNSGSRVDLLVPQRLDENGSELSNEIVRKDTTAFPNHSRYPGDKYGLRSHLGLNALTKLSQLRQINPFAHYSILDTMGGDKTDSLVPSSQSKMLRDLEISAVAPDLFDTTYYSIEPEFSKVYMQKLKEGVEKGNLLKAGGYVEDISKVRILGDHGSEPDKPMDVFQQIQISKQNKNPETFYFLKETKHLLTGWLHGFKVLDFSPENVKDWFANCDGDDTSTNYGKNAKNKIPGGCLKNGGRTGYSVKLFSGKMFKNGNLKLGGNGGGTGRILNPPDSRIW